MLKNITLLFFMIILLLSCGKKSDPIYKEQSLFKDSIYQTVKA